MIWINVPPPQAANMPDETGESPMSMFPDREKAAERKFERDQEAAFKMRARRYRQLGLWAAAKMGLTGDAAARYAREMLDAEITQHGDAPIIKKIHDDLIVHGVVIGEAEIAQELAAMASTARPAH
jgi:hypothetical protein